MIAEQILLSILLAVHLCSTIAAIKRNHRNLLFLLFAISSPIVFIMILSFIYGFDLMRFSTIAYLIPTTIIIIVLIVYSIGLVKKINNLKEGRRKDYDQMHLLMNSNVLLQEENEDLEKRLEQARKIEAIGRLIIGVSHDINNFLNPIVGYALLIRKNSLCNKDLTRYSENIINATNRLKNLADVLMDTSRSEPLNISIINLKHVAEQIASLLIPSCHSGINIEMNSTSQNVMIKANQGMLYSAVLNLCINAIDSIEGNGIITITSGTQNVDESNLMRRNFEISAGAYAFISVEDSGIGMEQELLDDIFKPFFSTKGPKGTGLGLPSVYNCVKAHCGFIDISSKLGKGTQITIFFPVHIES